MIADDHPLFREALTYIVTSVLPNCQIHEATDYSETKQLLAQQSFKLVFLDLNMPDSSGLTDLALIKKMYPQIPIIIVSANEEPEVVRTCLNFNASGYIIKSSNPEEIKSAIKIVLRGDTYVPDSIELNGSKSELNDNTTNRISKLTPSQLKILLEIGKGKLNKQIAYDLGISEATVKAHITSVFKKLGINNRTQALLFIKEHQNQNAMVI